MGHWSCTHHNNGLVGGRKVVGWGRCVEAALEVGVQAQGARGGKGERGKRSGRRGSVLSKKISSVFLHLCRQSIPGPTGTDHGVLLSYYRITVLPYHGIIEHLTCLLAVIRKTLLARRRRWCVSQERCSLLAATEKTAKGNLHLELGTGTGTGIGTGTESNGPISRGRSSPGKAQWIMRDRYRNRRTAIGEP